MEAVFKGNLLMQTPASMRKLQSLTSVPQKFNLQMMGRQHWHTKKNSKLIARASERSPYWEIIDPAASLPAVWNLPINPAPSTSGKGWTSTQDGQKDMVMEAKVRQLAVMAADRAQMHHNIGEQRDNWNRLFQGSVRLATVSAAILAALNGANPTSAIAVALLNTLTAAMMLVINHFQPSQLAEEQRGASRFIKSLVKEIERTLCIDPSLREDAQAFWQDKNHRLQKIAQSFPLPLTPNALDKFPKGLFPIRFTHVDESMPEIPVTNPCNGWTPEIAEDLKKVAERIREKDIEEYVVLGERALKLNKVLAVAAPAMALCAAAAAVVGVLVTKFNPSLIATVCSIMAFFSSSFSHDAQVGMVFEMYRGCASAYNDMDAMIQRTLRLPVEQRMNGELFHQYVALMLGRADQVPMLPEDSANAGLLF